MKSAKKAVAKAAVARKKAAAKKKARIMRKTTVTRPKIAAIAEAQKDTRFTPQLALQEEYTVEAENFGPIAEAKLTLKPLTVLIGPSNTGKTYMATLACMMMKKHLEFVNHARFRIFRQTNYEAMLSNASISELRSFSVKLATAVVKGDPVLLSALPDKFQKLWRPEMKSTFKDAWGNANADLTNYYGVVQLSDMLADGAQGSFKCKCTVNVSGEKMSGVRITASKNTAVAKQNLWDFRFPVVLSQISQIISDMKEVVNSSSSTQRRIAIAVEQAVDGILRFSDAYLSAHFLPASRGGLIQAQRVMSIAMMRIAGRAGLSDIRIPTLSRLNVDFLEEIEMLLGRVADPRRQPAYNIKRSGIPVRTRFRPHTASEATKVAERIENLLGGQIVPKKSGGNEGDSAIPPVVTMGYHPADFATPGAGIALDMAQSSSMVGEIAPLVLYLRGGIEPGDTLFIEEPEAHLHPAAQTTMAEILAAMIRAGIRVVITTHSDWLLDSIANLVRQGETNSKDGDLHLKEDEVGVYWFEPGKSGKGSKAIPQSFDNENGYLPKDVRAESTALYNKTVPLQSKLDEIRGE